MKLTLVRHTSLQIAEGICYGQSDVDVSANFHHELSTVQQKLQHEDFSAIYSSPLQRCHKLALGLAHALTYTQDIQLEPRLKELHFGAWEMQAWNDIPRTVFDVWAKNYAELAPPEGETFAQLQARGIAFVQELQSRHAGEHVLVVTHGGMIRALIAHALNMQLKGLFRLHIDYASLTQLDFAGEVPKIVFVNR
jgi:alpha-ribazole phosphatase